MPPQHPTGKETSRGRKVLNLRRECMKDSNLLLYNVQSHEPVEHQLLVHHWSTSQYELLVFVHYPAKSKKKQESYGLWSHLFLHLPKGASFGSV